MATVSSSPGLRQQRIRKVSRFFRWLSVVVAVQSVWLAYWSLSLPVVAVEPVFAFSVTRPADAPAPAPVPLSEPQMYLVTAGSGPSYRLFTQDVLAAGSGIRGGREWMARSMAVLWNAYLLVGALMCFRLFRSYEQGQIFALAGVRWLRSVGLWMMGLWGMGMVFQVSSRWWAESMMLRFDLGVGLLPGLFVFLIAWIMEEAHQIAEEQALTV